MDRISAKLGIETINFASFNRLSAYLTVLAGMPTASINSFCVN